MQVVSISIRETDRPVWEEARAEAQRRDTHLSRLVASALRDYLSKGEKDGRDTATR